MSRGKWNTKYDLTGDTLVVDNKTLHRIRAVRSFGLVRKGDLGGWIEHKRNLSHHGLCWATGEAKILGAGRVKGDAIIYQESIVRDHGEVSGKAEILGQSVICENGKVMDEAWIAGKAQIGGYCKIREFAAVYDDAGVYGLADVKGKSKIHGSAEVGGKMIVDGDTDLASGRHLGAKVETKPTLAPTRQRELIPRASPVVTSTAKSPSPPLTSANMAQTDFLAGLRKENETLKDTLSHIAALVAPKPQQSANVSRS